MLPSENGFFTLKLDGTGICSARKDLSKPYSQLDDSLGLADISKEVEESGRRAHAFAERFNCGSLSGRYIHAITSDVEELVNDILKMTNGD